jgi:H+/Cl- antiporter ClcA
VGLSIIDKDQRPDETSADGGSHGAPIAGSVFGFEIAFPGEHRKTMICFALQIVTTP